MSDQPNCPICFEKFDETPQINVCTNKCSHKFHCKCIQEWIDITNGTGTCPMCRADIDMEIPTRELPVIVAQRPNRNLINSFNEVYTPPRYGSLGLRRSNAITPEEEEAFNNTAQMMEYPEEYPDAAFDSPPRVRVNTPSTPGAPRRISRR
jgi:hypothetical protein